MLRNSGEAPQKNFDNGRVTRLAAQIRAAGHIIGATFACATPRRTSSDALAENSFPTMTVLPGPPPKLGNSTGLSLRRPFREIRDNLREAQSERER